MSEVAVAVLESTLEENSMAGKKKVVIEKDNQVKTIIMPIELVDRMRNAMCDMHIFKEAEFIRLAIEDKIEAVNKKFGKK
jgi:hypothetical protein